MSTVIKAGGELRAHRKLRTIDLADHLSTAQRVVDEARDSAARLIGQARLEAERIVTSARGQADAIRQQAAAEGHDQGRQSGLAEGMKQGLEEARAQFAAEHARLAEALSAALREFDARKRDLLAAADRDVLALAVAIAQKLTFERGRLHRDVAIENLKKCLELIRVRSDVRVRVHPDDEATLRLFAEREAAQMRTLEHVVIVADDQVAPGGCIVTAGSGDSAVGVDASLETQVAQVVELLLGPPQNGPAGEGGDA